MKKLCTWLTVLSFLRLADLNLGKMFLNILITLFLLGLCLGEKKGTVSSIRFHRDDVPLPYKYSSSYDYSMEKSRKYDDQPIGYFRHRPNMLKSIQYAPLNPEDETFSGQDITSPINKLHLEPRIIEKSANNNQVSQANILQYIEGHNILVPLKRNKDNGFSYDVFSEKNKEMEQIKYGLSLSKLDQENPEPERDVISLKPVTTAHSHIDFNNQQIFPTNIIPTKSYLSSLENTKIEPVFNSNVKIPRLHLNIARAYNFARLPLKASALGYQKLLLTNPKQTFVPNIDLLLQEKTFLYPVNSKEYLLRT